MILFLGGLSNAYCYGTMVTPCPVDPPKLLLKLTELIESMGHPLRTLRYKRGSRPLRLGAALRPAADEGTVNAHLVSATPHRDLARFELFSSLQ